MIRESIRLASVDSLCEDVYNHTYSMSPVSFEQSIFICEVHDELRLRGITLRQAIEKHKNNILKNGTKIQKKASCY